MARAALFFICNDSPNGTTLIRRSEMTSYLVLFITISSLHIFWLQQGVVFVNFSHLCTGWRAC